MGVQARKEHHLSMAWVQIVGADAVVDAVDVVVDAVGVVMVIVVVDGVLVVDEKLQLVMLCVHYWNQLLASIAWHGVEWQ